MRILPLLLLFPVLLAAEEDKLDELVTFDGKHYQAVTIRKVEPDGISIIHSAGTAKVPFEQLSSELQEKYGYDKDAATEHKKRLAEAQRKLEAAENAARSRQAKAASTTAGAEMDQKFAENLQKSAKMVSMRAIDNSPLGLLGEIREATLVNEPVKSKMGSTVGHKPTWAFKGRAFDGFVADAKGARVGKESAARGVDVDLPEVVSTYTYWEGMAWRTGMIRYRNKRGQASVKPLYTASEAKAAAFFKANGFGAKSENVIRDAE